MDSRTVLDYALFQLTPTRTRCDLVIFAGKKSEKIASGLLEPFLGHLRSAKDQISKGGYSITLKPQSVEGSSWFTKATLERFVRFVSTPEVLERVVTIETEINQIESSNEQVNGTEGTPSHGDFRSSVTPFKPKSENNCGNDVEVEENPKIRLHRVLETRKAMLKKEQGMAYARALVAGFEMDYIYDLVSFSDAFGAQRLREACINFMELCNKKNDDKIWLDEVAAMQSSYFGASGTVFGGENSDLYQTGRAKSSASESYEGTENGLPVDFNPQHTERATTPLPNWPNNPPQYMQTSHGSMSQRFQPYPGYIYPGPPSHYPGHGPWPGNFHDSGLYLDRDVKDSKRYKSVGKHARRHSSKDEGGEIDESSSGSDSSDEHREERLSPKKKHNRRSSRKVVIRNINYIASASNQESGSDSDSSSSEDDEDSIKHQVEAAVGSLKKHRKSKNKARHDSKRDETREEKKDGNWDIFQTLLLKEPDSRNEQTISNAAEIQEEYLIAKENSDKKFDKPKYASDDFLSTERNGIQESYAKFEGGEVFHGVVNQSNNEDLLMPTRTGEYYSRSGNLGDESSTIKTSKEEDWIVGNKPEISTNSSRSVDLSIFRDGENKRDVISDDSFMVQSRISDGPLQSKADIFTVTDITGGDHSETSKTGNLQEFEDFSMMLGHNSTAEKAATSAGVDLNYGNDISLYEIQSKPEPLAEVDATTPPPNGKTSSVKNGKKVTGKESTPKAPNRSLVRSKSDIPTRSKMSTSASTRGKPDKEEEKRRKMEELAAQRQKRIAERSAAKGVKQEIPKKQTKEIKKKNPNLVSTDENKKSPKPVIRSSTIDRLATARTTNKQSSTASKGQNRKPTSKVAPSTVKKTKATQIKPSDKKTSSNNPRRESNAATPVISEDSRREEEAQTGMKVGNEDCAMDSVDERESTAVSTKDASEEKNNSIHMLPSDSSMPKEEQLHDDNRVGITLENNLKSAISNSNEKGIEKKKLSFSPEISVMNISTPPSDNESSQELNHSRKKWNNGEISPKIPKGFRKLIFFGRRS